MRHRSRGRRRPVVLLGTGLATLALVIACTGDVPFTANTGDTAAAAQVAASARIGSPWSWTPAHERPQRTRHRRPATSTATQAPTPSPTSAGGSGTSGGSGGTSGAKPDARASRPAATGSTTPVNTGDFPYAGSTGVQAGTSLQKHSGDLVVTKSNTTISGYDITGGLTVKGDNVTVTNVRVRCGGVDDFCVRLLGTGDVLDRAEVGGGANGSTLTTAVGIWAGGDTGSADSTRITRANVHHTSDGLRVDGSTTLSDSYIHDLSYADGAHSDGTQNTSGAHVVFRHNTFDGATNCTIFLQPSGDTPIADVLIDNNLLLGESRSGQTTSYLICVDRRVSRVSVTNNRFSRTGWLVGPATENFPWAVWSGNAWQDGTVLSRA